MMIVDRLNSLTLLCSRSARSIEVCFSRSLMTVFLRPIYLASIVRRTVERGYDYFKLSVCNGRAKRTKGKFNSSGSSPRFSRSTRSSFLESWWNENIREED